MRIILHHSLTKDSETVSWNAIRKYHRSLGWSDIGYHYGIERVNDSYEIMLGRFESRMGAHTKGHNKHSIGICLVGNFDLEEPDFDMWCLAIDLVKDIMKRHNFGGNLSIPVESVLGHRELASYKSCPGHCFNLDLFRSQL